ncbi:MAG: hypothetical protein E7559_03480 [Ruminococcaceae bacterium]|nr:hypothetical protein [Oscillospiraceae bacterium]
MSKNLSGKKKNKPAGGKALVKPEAGKEKKEKNTAEAKSEKLITAEKLKARFNWLYGDKALAVFSVLISISLWVFITLNVTDASTKTIKEVPIRIDTTNIEETFGLKKIAIMDPPALSDAKVDVILSGSIYQLSRVDPEDVTVTAQVTGVNRAGEFTLSLVPMCSVNNVNVDIENGYTFVKVWFDYIREKDIAVDKVKAAGVTAAAEDLIIGDAVSSIKSLRISGPATVIDNIDTVQIRADVNKELSEPFETAGKICYLNAEGEDISSDHVSFITILDYNGIEEETGTAAGVPADDEINVIIPVSKKAQLPLGIAFKNVPDGFDTNTLSYSISPETITVEGDIEAIDKMVSEGKYMVDGIDLTELSPSETKFRLKLNLSTGIEEMNGVSEVDVTFNLEGYSTKTIGLADISQFKLSGDWGAEGSGHKAEILTESLRITVAGPTSVIGGMGQANCSVTVDMEAHDGTAGQRKMPAIITFKNDNKCWVIGTYTVMVNVE